MLPSSALHISRAAMLTLSPTAEYSDRIADPTIPEYTAPEDMPILQLGIAVLIAIAMSMPRLELSAW